jgi:hypothetical protein
MPVSIREGQKDMESVLVQGQHRGGVGKRWRLAFWAGAGHAFTISHYAIAETVILFGAVPSGPKPCRAVLPDTFLVLPRAGLRVRSGSPVPLVHSVMKNG